MKKLIYFSAIIWCIQLSALVDKQGVSMEITKVVIPAAGYGTRFLPFTKSIPKELLPLLNKPVLQEIVEEAIQANLTHCCMVVNSDKKSIQDYFTRNPKLERELARYNKLHLLDSLHALIDKTTFSYFNQLEMKGLADAVMTARPAIGNEYFGVILPDMIIPSANSMIGELVTLARKHLCTIIAIQEVPADQIHLYGAVKFRKKLSDDLYELDDVIEKPRNAQEAPSLYAIVGRYVFPPAIFDAIEAITPHAQGEILLTDAITHLAHTGHTVLAYIIKNPVFDTGRPPGWLAAQIYYGIRSPEYGTEIRAIVSKINY